MSAHGERRPLVAGGADQFGCETQARQRRAQFVRNILEQAALGGEQRGDTLGDPQRMAAVVRLRAVFRGVRVNRYYAASAAFSIVTACYLVAVLPWRWWVLARVILTCRLKFQGGRVWLEGEVASGAPKPDRTLIRGLRASHVVTLGCL